MVFANAIVFCLGVYFGIGVIVALLFVAFGVTRIDHAAKGASIFFRPMIFLGCVGLWPFVILRFLSMKKINEAHEAEI